MLTGLSLICRCSLKGCWDAAFPNSTLRAGWTIWHLTAACGQVLFVYSKEKALLKNAVPSSLPADLDGKCFHDNLGDFFCASFPVEEEIVSMERLYLQSVETLLASSKVSNLMLVPDVEAYGHLLKGALSKSRKALLFVTEPVTGFLCPQEILTYSLFAALGVKGEELS